MYIIRERKCLSTLTMKFVAVVDCRTTQVGKFRSAHVHMYMAYSVAIVCGNASALFSNRNNILCDNWRRHYQNNNNSFIQYGKYLQQFSWNLHCTFEMNRLFMIWILNQIGIMIANAMVRFWINYLILFRMNNEQTEKLLQIHVIHDYYCFMKCVYSLSVKNGYILK